MSAGRAASAGLTLRRSYPLWWIAALSFGVLWIGAGERPWRAAVDPARAAGAWRASVALPWLAFGGGVLLARFLAQLERLRQVERAGLGTGLGGPADALRGALLGAALAGALFAALLSGGLHLASAAVPPTHRALESPSHTALLARDGAALDLRVARGATHLAVPLRRVPGRPAPDELWVSLRDAGGAPLVRARWRPGAETLLALPGGTGQAPSPPTLSLALSLELGSEDVARTPALYVPADGLRWLRREPSAASAALALWLWATTGWLAWCGLGAWLSAGLGSVWVLLLAATTLGAAWFSDAVAPWMPLGDCAERAALWRSGWSSEPRAGAGEWAGLVLWLAALGPGAGRLAEPRPGAREVDA